MGSRVIQWADRGVGRAAMGSVLDHAELEARNLPAVTGAVDAVEAHVLARRPPATPGPADLDRSPLGYR